MASGKQSPRQKMINLMYLIFIAMLAMNMSKEVLQAFGLMDNKLVAANDAATVRNKRSYEDLALKAVEQSEKYADEKEKADKIKELSESYYSYLEGIKEEMKATVDDPTDYQTMDSGKFLDEKFFKGNDGEYREAGQEFLDRMNNYRTEISAVIGEGGEGMKTDVEARFSTDKVTNREGKERFWLDFNYKGFPLVASITKMTQIQADIKTTESEVLGSMLQGQMASDVSMNNYQAILIPNNPATLQGENFQGKIVLGRYDGSLKPTKVVINGKEITNIKDGGAILDFPAGNVGENEIKGKFIFMENGEPVEIPVETSYAVVAKPNSAVISADKMNVVYRGVQNPITVSVPGVADNAVKATAPGLKKVKGIGKYVMAPGKGREVKITVSAKLPDGTPISSSQMFRIKDIPAPVAAVRGEYGMIKMPKSTLQKATISSMLPDFVFDLKINTTGFSVKVPGQPTVIVKGNKFDSSAIRVLNKARKGDVVIIFDIKQKLVGNSGYYLKNASPVNVEITN
ncbi:gliding motility protein GldM [Lutimonas saemankumensis]|uniref:type IX secretion system motor protein PorM/GldM n=1 Tax=Lutimonas saemankumensis TaxID=483016 RepID=UPI001CD749ED|nr:gliding motility protein GldM [Lutimonas saemankumensis]MCA0933721.1 gliding motility protein GldM [Lutimonas saemankumensis]